MNYRYSILGVLVFLVCFSASNAQVANYSLTLSSSGKVFYNTGVFPDSFQLWYLHEGLNNPLTQSNTVGNPPPSVTYSNSGRTGSNGYTMGGVTSSLIYQADVMFTNPPTAEGIYMYFRMVDRQNYYTAKYGPYYGGILVLSKNVGGIGSEIVPPLYGLPSSANTWYNLEVRAIGSSLQVYFDHTLKINATDASFASGLTGLSLGICCSASNTWYVDNIKVFKSYQITVNNLQQGQKVELYDSSGSLKASGTVAAGNTSLVLDVSSLSFPFSGYFKVYNSSGILLLISQTYNDIWGGDEYNFQSTPTLSSPANGATNQPTTLTLTWSAVTGATRYRLQVSTSSAFTTTVLDDSTITTTFRQVGPLANNTTYYWRVAAGNASGWSAFSSPYSFTTTLATLTLSSPQNGATNQPTTLTLAWNTVTGATRYRLQVSTSSVFTTTLLDDSTITTTSRQVGPLANNTTYYWRVAAGTASGWGEFSSPYTFTTGLAAPTLSSPANGATNQPTTLTLSWSAVTGATRYRLQVSTSSVFTTTVLDDSTITTTSRQVGPLAYNTTYYWRVAAGNASGWSTFSSPYSFTTTLAAPTLSSPQNGATNQPTTLTLGWNAVTGATRYRLQVSTSSAFTTTVLDDSTITTTFRQVGPLANNTTYYWRVAAGNASGWGEFSSPYTFTTGLAAPALSSPANGAANQPTTLTLSWNAVSGAAAYRLQVSMDQNFNSTLLDDSTITTTSRQLSGLAYNATYYWRVAARNAGGAGPFSSTSAFTTMATTTVSLSQPLFFPSNPTSSTDYRLVSVPGASVITVQDILSGAQKTDWRIYRDNGASSNFLVELSASSALTTGEGYWLLKKGPLNITRSVTMPALSPDGTYSIPLHAGWNIIANPFDRSVPWSAVRSVNLLPATLQPLAYNGTYSSSSTLEPFAGYYFDNRTAGLSQLKIPYPSTAMKVADPEPPRVEWRLQLIFSSDINEDRENYIGIAPSASLERDDLDLRKPPLFLDQGFLYFERPEWDHEYRRFAADFRPALGEGQVWDFEVSNPRLSLAKITVHGVEQIPADYDIKLINLANTTPVDVRSTNAYSYQTVSERMKFKLIVGKKSYIQKEMDQLIPETFALEQNYPNPFNPSTSITYKVPRESHVRLDVYSALGQVVATLVDARVPPGTYTALWNGTDRSGVRVASGVYLYRMLVDGSVVSTRRMIILK